MAPMLETLAIVHGLALAGLLVAARTSVRLVDDQGRPLPRRSSRKDQEPAAGDVADPTALRQNRPARPKPRWLA